MPTAGFNDQFSAGHSIAVINANSTVLLPLVQRPFTAGISHTFYKAGNIHVAYSPAAKRTGSTRFWHCAAAKDYRGSSDEPIETVYPGLNVRRAVNEA